MHQPCWIKTLHRLRQRTMSTQAADTRAESSALATASSQWHWQTVTHEAFRHVCKSLKYSIYVSEAWTKKLSPIVALLSMLPEPCIPMALLRNGGSPASRRSPQGEVHEISPLDSGLDPEISSLLSHADDLEAVIYILRSRSLVGPAAGLTNITIDPKLKLAMQVILQGNKRLRRFWWHQTWSLLCHGLPRPIPETVISEALGSAYLENLVRLINIDIHRWKQDLTDEGDGYITEPRDASRQQPKPETQDDIFLSNAVLDASLKDAIAASEENTPFYQATLDLLRVSRAVNYMRMEFYDNAIEEVQQWRTVEVGSLVPVELLIYLKRAAILGRLLRLCGRTDEASSLVQSALIDAKREHVDAFEIRSDLALTLGEIFIDREEPSATNRLLTEELDWLNHTGGGHSSTAIEIQLMLAEAQLQKYNIEAASAAYFSVRAKLSSAKSLHDTPVHMQLSIGHARVFHMQRDFHQAMVQWGFILRDLERQEILGRKSGPYAAVTMLKSIQHCFLQNGGVKHANEQEARIREMQSRCKPGGSQYILPGLGTWWLKCLQGIPSRGEVFKF